MIVIDDAEVGCTDEQVLLYADDELLHVAAQQNDGERRALPPPAAGLGAILRDYVHGRNGAANGALFAPLQRRFEIIAQTFPGARAVKFDHRLLTYGELDEQADELALQLQRDGLLPGSFCMLRLEPSLARVRAILAILKAGAACLEVDSALPRASMASVLEVFRPSLLFVRRGDSACPHGGQMRTIQSDEDALSLPHGWPDETAVLAGTPAHAFASVSDSGSLCMAVHTHRALGARLDASCSVLSAVDPSNFWRPLSAGALLTIAPNA